MKYFISTCNDPDIKEKQDDNLKWNLVKNNCNWSEFTIELLLIRVSLFIGMPSTYMKKIFTILNIHLFHKSCLS